MRRSESFRTMKIPAKKYSHRWRRSVSFKSSLSLGVLKISILEILYGWSTKTNRRMPLKARRDATRQAITVDPHCIIKQYGKTLQQEVPVCSSFNFLGSLAFPVENVRESMLCKEPLSCTGGIVLVRARNVSEQILRTFRYCITDAIPYCRAPPGGSCAYAQTAGLHGCFRVLA